MRESSAPDVDDLAVCRSLLCGGSRSFFAAARLLPRPLRESATALYAFCRQADDAIDLGADPHAAVDEVKARLAAIYAGQATNAVDRAFAAVVTAHAVPLALPAALIEGLAWDAQGRRYENFDALLDYAARVAGAVGVMMALLMGVKTQAGLARAADLGVAMQLTNIARDVGEDARAGRLFLPLDWMAQAGLDPAAFLAAPQFTPALGDVVQRLLAQAAAFYARAEDGIAMLPRDCRIGIAAAAQIYAGIGKKIAAAGYDSVTARARVTGREKIIFALRAAGNALRISQGPASPPALPATLFLVAAAACAEPRETSGVIKLLAMFERLERAQREAASRITA